MTEDRAGTLKINEKRGIVAAPPLWARVGSGLAYFETFVLGNATSYSIIK